MIKSSVTLRNYQEDAIKFLESNNGKLVLAMCPSSGKTETIIYHLNNLYKTNQNIKVLILPHSTNVLLDNFYQRLESRNVDFTYSSDVNDDVNVHVILPQNHNKIVGKYDLIIIDEAHENYLAKTIQGIIKKTQVDKEILLTGTPSKFIGNNDFKLHFVALSDLCELYTPKLRIDILESDYDWNGNYSQTKELKNSYKFTKESTESSLKKTFDFLLKRNDSNSVEKTLIVCRNIAQSNYVKEYLTSIGFSSEISNSDNDKDSENVSKFKNNLIDILIVVNRARLGYDDTDLINLIDMSGTLNPNIIYQMFARLLRGTQDMKKYYIRLTSKNDDVYNSEIATSVALMLTHTNYIKVFNGKNFNSQDIIVNKDFFIKGKKSLDKSNGKSKNLSKRKLFIDVQEDDTSDVINFFKEVIEQKEKNVGLYKFCKVQDILFELNTRKNLSRTKEECIENALQYNSVKDWFENDSKIHRYAKSKEWYHECTSHMINLGGKSRTKEECIENALKYKNVSEWKEKDKNIQSYAYRKEWYPECIAHMDKLNGISKTKKECIENALKYNSKTEWREKDRIFYSYAWYKNWLSECTAHMENLGSETRTKEECINNALKYKTKSEWRKKDRTFYYYAYRKGWFSECTAHMKNLGGETRTKEECVKNARKYKTCKDWIKYEKKMYMYSQMKGWLDDCTAHMEKLITQRTKEGCIENARKYNSVKEWRKNDKSIQLYSRPKEWYNECIAHMEDSKKTNLSFKYSKKYCIEIGSKYSSLKEWANDETDYKILNFVKRVGWYNECRDNMNKKRVFRSKEECIENARKYNTINDWVNNDNAIYSYAKKRQEWYNECTAHMKILKVVKRTKEECIENALKYKNISEWRKKDSKYYYCAVSKEWYHECTAHMVKLYKTRTKEQCIEDARKYNSKSEWAKKSKTIYNYSRIKSWYKECLEHFEK